MTDIEQVRAELLALAQQWEATEDPDFLVRALDLAFGLIIDEPCPSWLEDAIREQVKRAKEKP